MSRTCVIVGIGNPLQGPDAFGPAVIERLGARPDLPAGVQLIDAHTDLLSCLDRFVEAQDVVLVDAFLGPGTGTVMTVDEPAFSAWSTESPGSHDLSPALVIQLFRLLHPGVQARFTLVGLDVDRVGSGPLSADAVRAGVDAVLGVLRAAG